MTRKEKSYWNLKQSQKQELNSDEIDQFWSISWSGRTYPHKILHGRMKISYRSIQNCSSVEDDTFLKERGMLGSYSASDSPITIVIVALIVIIVMSTLILLWPFRLLYIEMRFYHLYQRRIVHLCNVKEVSPLNKLILKLLIHLFYPFVRWFHNTQNVWLRRKKMQEIVKERRKLHNMHNQVGKIKRRMNMS